MFYDRAMKTEDQTPASEGAAFEGARKLSYREARLEQLVFWSRKSVAERLAAMTALTRRMVEMRGIAYDEREADFTVSRVRRRRG